jgi:hypothetical protein
MVAALSSGLCRNTSKSRETLENAIRSPGGHDTKADSWQKRPGYRKPTAAQMYQEIFVFEIPGTWAAVTRREAAIE